MCIGRIWSAEQHKTDTNIVLVYCVCVSERSVVREFTLLCETTRFKDVSRGMWDIAHRQSSFLVLQHREGKLGIWPALNRFGVCLKWSNPKYKYVYKYIINSGMFCKAKMYRRSCSETWARICNGSQNKRQTCMECVWIMLWWWGESAIGAGFSNLPEIYTYRFKHISLGSIFDGMLSTRPNKSLHILMRWTKDATYRIRWCHNVICKTNSYC